MSEEVVEQVHPATEEVQMPEQYAESILNTVEMQTVVETITLQEALQEAIELEARVADMQRLIDIETEYAYKGQLQQLRNETFTNAFMLTQFIGALTPESRNEALERLDMTHQQLEEQVTKGMITPVERTLQEFGLRQHTRIDEIEQEIEKLDPPQISLSLIDFQALCELDAYYHDTYPVQTEIIMQQIEQMCEAKMYKIPAMVGYKALQEALLELYVPAYASFPFTLNIFCMRMTALSITQLIHKQVTIYATGAVQDALLSLKEEIGSCEMRRIETKLVSGGKTATDAIPNKYQIAQTDDLTGDEKLGVPRNPKGHQTLWLMLRYAYSMPYWIRRMIAIHTGMPENYKYALYFGIGGLPSRYSTWKRDFYKYPEAQYVTYSVNEHVMKLIQRISYKRYTFYERYADYYDKRRM
jgi:hypothetical protein